MTEYSGAFSLASPARLLRHLFAAYSESRALLAAPTPPHLTQTPFGGYKVHTLTGPFVSVFFSRRRIPSSSPHIVPPTVPPRPSSWPPAQFTESSNSNSACSSFQLGSRNHIHCNNTQQLTTFPFLPTLNHLLSHSRPLTFPKITFFQGL